MSLKYEMSMTRGKYDAFKHDTMVINVTATLNGERTYVTLSGHSQEHWNSDGDELMIDVFRIWDERSAGWHLIDVQVINSAEQPTIDHVIRAFFRDPAVRRALIWEPIDAEQRSTEPSIVR